MTELKSGDMVVLNGLWLGIGRVVYATPFTVCIYFNDNPNLRRQSGCWNFANNQVRRLSHIEELAAYDHPELPAHITRVLASAKDDAGLIIDCLT